MKPLKVWFCLGCGKEWPFSDEGLKQAEQHAEDAGDPPHAIIETRKLKR